MRTLGVRGWTALLVVYVVWGSTYLAIRYAIEGFPSLLSAALRFLSAAALLGTWVTVAHRRRTAPPAAPRGKAPATPAPAVSGGAAGSVAAEVPAGPAATGAAAAAGAGAGGAGAGGVRVRERVTAAQAGTAALSGVLLLAGGNGLVTIAQQQVDSGLAALLVACTPLWIVVLRVVLRDRPRPATAAGVLLGLVGVGVIFLPGGSGDTALGHAALVVVAALSWSIGSLLVTRRPVPAEPLVLITIQMAAGGALLLAVSAARGEWSGFSFAEVPGRSWLALAYLIVFGSLLAFSAYVWLLGNAPVSLVATYAYVNPAVAVLLGAVVAGERLTPSALAGGLVVLLAVGVVVTAESRRKEVS